MIIARLPSLANHCNTRLFALFLTLGSIIALAGCTVEPQPSRIYFTAKTIGPSVNIYSISDSGVLTKHTDDDRWRDLDANVSPNGALVFSSNRKDESKIDLNKRSESFDIFLRSNKKSEIVRLSSDEPIDTQPKISPKGDAVGYIKKLDDEQKLIVYSLESGQTHDVLSAPQIADYAWSKDAQSMVVAHGGAETSEMTLLDLKAGTEKTLLSLTRKPPKDQPGFRPNDTDAYMKTIAFVCWSPDEKKIAYIRHPEFRGVRQLRLYNLETQQDALISEPKVQVQDHCDWSDDSTKLLYAGLVDYRFYFDEQTQRKVYEGSMQVFEHSVGGANEQLTQGQHMFKHPVYSPDEKHIAYLYSEQLGARVYQLYTMKKNGADARKLFDKVAPISGLSWQAVQTLP